MNEEIKNRIETMIRSKKVFLFLKGTPESPKCGFSLRVIQILKNLHVDFGYCNVLEEDDIRQGIKEYADWPTIPQLYIDGKFIGGCDIAEELYRSGELQKCISK
ncbi:MAG TPA: Grx4 family monothiol glutaredoxin [Candidatus Nanoarchaeia archaeon]|nr:Grx4 family monothiol glutaredoxin [Candidatus Nanoarchaeia archaeon]